MKTSLVISGLLHAVILALAVFGLPGPDEFDVKNAEAVPVDILTVDEFTKLQAQSKTAAKTDTPAPKKPEKPPEPKPERKAAPEQKVAALPPTPAEPEPAPAPQPKREAVEPPAPRREAAKPKAAPEPAPEPEPKEPEQPKATAQPAPKPRIKPKAPKRVEAPETKKSEFDVDDIAALLNKIPEKAEPRPIDPGNTPEGSPTIGDLARLQGSDATLSIDEIDYLRQQIRGCWTLLRGAENADELIVKLKIELNRDGSLTGPPQLMNDGSSPYFQVAAERAMLAVRECQPYQLPAEKYEAWSTIIMTFDPREMLR